MPLFDAVVRTNREIAPDYYRLEFPWPAEVPDPLPGQFLSIRVADSAVPLLRRPFALASFSAAVASIVYWRRGEGTRVLAAAASGDALNILAPLGRPFPEPTPGSVPVLVAGGIGVGPIVFLANSLAARRPAPLMILGARTASALPRLAVDRGVQIRTATDDGTAGYHGTAIDLLDETVGNTAGVSELYLCGPHAMLAAGHRLASAHGLTAWVSLEQTMGCGVGACMGCAVRVTGPERYARVCTEGPVFRSSELTW